MSIMLCRSKYKTEKELWAVILKTFGGNEATKKTKKNLLKQQYGNFKVEGSETLEKTFNRLQVIVGQLQFMNVEIEKDDLNKKLLTSLAPEWLMHTIVWRNRTKHSSGKEDGNTASVPTASTNVPTASASITNISQETACAYIASQSSGSQIKFEDINQIDKDDMEEMDIKWNMALLSMRADKFWNKTGKKISIQGSDVAGFDKSKVECFNCHKIGHFARECRAPRSQDRGRRDNFRQGSRAEKQAPKALMAIDGVGWHWSYMANNEEDHALVTDEVAPTEFALMANTSDKTLAQVESRLVEYKEREVKYIEKIKTLEYYNESYKESNESLKKKLETLQQEKERVDGKLAGLLIASKDLDNLIESQRSEKNKEGLRYTAVPPPTAQLYLSPKKDLSSTGLPECADDTVTDYSRPSSTIKMRSPSRAPWVPTVNRNYSPVNRKFSTGSRNFPTANRKFPTASRKFITGSTKSITANLELKGKAGSSQNKIDDKGYWDSGCSRHMTGNISYLFDFEPYDGGYVSFSQGGCKITGKRIIKTVLGRDFKLLDDANILLRTPRQHNMYSIDLNNIVPHRDLTCLVAKASADECMLWHRRLARTMLADAKLPVTFWAEAVNTACYVQNRVLVNNSYNKTPYELFNGRSPAIGFLKPFGCHVMILNTLDNLGKFEEKGDEGYFIGYSMSSKAFRVFNKRTRRVEENLHVEFLENKAIEKGSGPNWLFDIDSLTKYMNYVPVDAGVRPIWTKWVLKNKKDERRIIIRNKARLVAQGHTQEEGIDYNEVFSPVARIEAIRLFLAYASFMDFVVYQMDVKSAFLYGTIDEEVYVILPPGFQDLEFPSKVYKVEKAMYGLHQAPRAWYVLQKEDVIFLSQDKYVGDILKKFGYTDVRSSNTPMDKENPWGKDGTRKDIDLHLYRSMIGSLMYLTVSRPDVMFAICACARHQVTPKEYHLHAVKRIFRYLKGHPKLGLWRLISWQCKKQTIVATLTTEVEYVAAASCCGQVLWIQNQLLDYGLSMPCEALSREYSTSILCLIHTAKTFDLVWIWLGGDYGNVFLMGFDGIQRTRIAQSSVPPSVADESASPHRDVSQGEACPTDSGFIADQDRATIAKSSTLPYHSAPRVTSPTAVEGKINRLKERVMMLEERERAAATNSGDDAPIKGRTTVLVSGGTVPTSSEEIPTASLVFATATVVAKELKEQLEREDQRRAEQIARDAEIARIHTEEEIQKLPMQRRIELISDLVKYQDNYTKVYKFQSQQIKLWTKKQKRDYYMAVIRNNLGWKEEAKRIKRKGINLEQKSAKRQKSSEKKFMWKHFKSNILSLTGRFIQRVRGATGRLLDWEETLSTRPPTSDKEMELWVELSRMYEPDKEDQLWTHTQNFMHALVNWKLYDLCGVHHVTSKDKEIFMLVEKDYPLRKGESSHWQYKFPLLVEGVPTARRMEIPLPGVCAAMMKKLQVKENWQLH
uniref:CCHC-type domain-containing protein n=1 Tax=Tanacetum cinerariifolium TaxID=118510 RepID=A0A6L2LLW6_TANCI|nr:hypothetical protein [Tanacetum cinerariifolium]